jgi:hypothetical protein
MSQRLEKGNYTIMPGYFLQSIPILSLWKPLFSESFLRRWCESFSPLLTDIGVDKAIADFN